MFQFGPASACVYHGNGTSGDYYPRKENSLVLKAASAVPQTAYAAIFYGKSFVPAA
jgi:hypothetical protein